eukprot:TRINITY_DN43358_c0_g1_i2.p1 TRINITY_DN43358_c0_g1~~TRINITY_DN43358_c0_g1_i2.p1  ORF type:complete len:160 (+),score=26.81 TRINITY_DN43358_c0_g1_i2:156-635(+)
MEDDAHDVDSVVEKASLPDAVATLPPLGGGRPLSSVPAWKRPPSRQFTLRKNISRPGSSQESRLAPTLHTSLPPTSSNNSEDYLSAWSLRNAPDAATTASIQSQRGTQERLGNLLVREGGASSSSNNNNNSRVSLVCLLYTSDAADEEDSVDLGGRRII